MKFDKLFWMALAGTALGSLTSQAEPTKPVWLTDCSLNIKESYDNNVFLGGAATPAVPTVPAGSVAALADSYSWITTVSARLGVNFSPLLGAQTNLPLLSLTYAPEFAVNHNQDTESFCAHRLLSAIKARTDTVVLSADNNFAYIDGSDMGPVYPGGYSAFATTIVRGRRDQIQESANVNVQYNQDKWFVRPAAAFVYYDLLTKQINTPGYQNYCDRYDVNGGVDFGYKLKPDLAVTLGYRYGHQYQEQFSFSTYSSSSDYQRVLVGIEGKPWKWLNVKIVGGPDFRTYEDNSASHVTPAKDLRPVEYYGEALVTATLSPEQTLTFKYKYWRWLSGSGKVPYDEGTYELAWHGKLVKQLAFDLAGKFSSYDYTVGNLASSKRQDLFYAVTPSLIYAVNSHVSINLSASWELGRNHQDGIANPQSREFDRQVVSLGAQFKF
jgi:hypothetical protein